VSETGPVSVAVCIVLCVSIVMLCISGGSDQRGLYIVCRCSPVNKSITDRYVSTYVVLPGTDGIHTVYPPPSAPL